MNIGNLSFYHARMNCNLFCSNITSCMNIQVPWPTFYKVQVYSLHGRFAILFIMCSFSFRQWHFSGEWRETHWVIFLSTSATKFGFTKPNQLGFLLYKVIWCIDGWRVLISSFFKIRWLPQMHPKYFQFGETILFRYKSSI